MRKRNEFKPQNELRKHQYFKREWLGTDFVFSISICSQSDVEFLTACGCLLLAAVISCGGLFVRALISCS